MIWRAVPAFVLLIAIFPLSAQEAKNSGSVASTEENPLTQPTEPTNTNGSQTPQVPAAGDPLYAPLAVGRQSAEEKFMDYATATVGPRALVGPALLRPR